MVRYGHHRAAMVDAAHQKALCIALLKIESVSDESSALPPGSAQQVGGIQRLYTPAMLAELLHVPVAAIRRWHRCKLIVPNQEVRRLPYFDVPEVATAQRLAQLLRAGVSPQDIEKKLADLARLLPGVERPLLHPSVIVQGQKHPGAAGRRIDRGWRPVALRLRRHRASAPCRIVRA